MLRALLLGDHSETATHSVEQMSRVLSDLYDGMFQVETQTQYGALTAKTLTNFDLVINYAAKWAENGTRQAAGALTAYVADGGNYLALHAGLEYGTAAFGLNCLTASRLIDKGSPCLMRFEKTKTVSPITDGLAPFEVLEEPARYFLDPVVSPAVLIQAPYGSGQLPVLWSRHFGWGSVVCLTAGHSRDSVTPFFSKVLYRSALWFLDRI